MINKVQSILDLCDLANSYRAANCIKKSIKVELGQFWNVVVGNYLLLDWSYYYSGGCDKQLVKFGLYDRAIIMWKAHIWFIYFHYYLKVFPLLYWFKWLICNLWRISPNLTKSIKKKLRKYVVFEVQVWGFQSKL